MNNKSLKYWGHKKRFVHVCRSGNRFESDCLRISKSTWEVDPSILRPLKGEDWNEYGLFEKEVERELLKTGAHKMTVYKPAKKLHNL